MSHNIILKPSSSLVVAGLASQSDQVSRQRRKPKGSTSYIQTYPDLIGPNNIGIKARNKSGRATRKTWRACKLVFMPFPVTVTRIWSLDQGCGEASLVCATRATEILLTHTRKFGLATTFWLALFYVELSARSLHSSRYQSIT